jgi:hypothetical protein
VSAAGAQGLIPIFDHLKCYNIKDYRMPGVWKADLKPEQAPPFAAELGCKIKSPAKLFCIDVQKTPVGTPTPPLHVVGIKAQDYLCYRLVCPVPSPMPTLAVADQFGQGGIVVKKPRFLCAPAYKVGFPTATATPQATPTLPGPSSTVTPIASPTPCPKQCIAGPNNGGFCNTASACPGGTCALPPCCCAGVAQGTPPCTSSSQCALRDVCICP